MQTNILHISRMDISESKRHYNVIPSPYYFYIKTNMLADFQFCISVPLNKLLFSDNVWFGYKCLTIETINQKIPDECLDNLILNIINTLRKNKKRPDASSISEPHRVKKSRHYHRNYREKTIFLKEACVVNLKLVFTD